MRSFRREILARAFLNSDTRASLIKSQRNEREERSKWKTRASARQIHELGQRYRGAAASSLVERHLEAVYDACLIGGKVRL